MNNASEARERYQLVLDPGEYWMVWDDLLEVPAVFGGRSLTGLPRTEAEEYLAVLRRGFLPRPALLQARLAAAFAC